MSFKFLIDECLTPELVRMAHHRGHPESTCVRDRGWSGLKDHQLMRHVVAEDFTLVTTNSYDFRGAAGGPVGGLHAKTPIHAGLVCLNSALPMHLDRQRELFGFALDELAPRPDLINRALEVSEDDTGQVTVDEYEIPRRLEQSSSMAFANRESARRPRCSSPKTYSWRAPWPSVRRRLSKS